MGGSKTCKLFIRPETSCFLGKARRGQTDTLALNDWFDGKIYVEKLRGLYVVALRPNFSSIPLHIGITKPSKYSLP
jgi:hypothetical protein